MRRKGTVDLVIIRLQKKSFLFSLAPLFGFLNYFVSRPAKCEYVSNRITVKVAFLLEVVEAVVWPVF